MGFSDDILKGLSYGGGLAGALAAGGPQAMGQLMATIADKQKTELSNQWEAYHRSQDRAFTAARDAAARSHDERMLSLRDETGNAEAVKQLMAAFRLDSSGGLNTHWGAAVAALPSGKRAAVDAAVGKGDIRGAASIIVGSTGVKALGQGGVVSKERERAEEAVEVAQHFGVSPPQTREEAIDQNIAIGRAEARVGRIVAETSAALQQLGNTKVATWAEANRTLESAKAALGKLHSFLRDEDGITVAVAEKDKVWSPQVAQAIAFGKAAVAQLENQARVLGSSQAAVELEADIRAGNLAGTLLVSPSVIDDETAERLIGSDPQVVDVINTWHNQVRILYEEAGAEGEEPLTEAATYALSVLQEKTGGEVLMLLRKNAAGVAVGEIDPELLSKGLTDLSRVDFRKVADRRARERQQRIDTQRARQIATAWSGTSPSPELQKKLLEWGAIPDVTATNPLLVGNGLVATTGFDPSENNKFNYRGFDVNRAVLEGGAALAELLGDEVYEPPQHSSGEDSIVAAKQAYIEAIRKINTSLVATGLTDDALKANLRQAVLEHISHRLEGLSIPNISRETLNEFTATLTTDDVLVSGKSPIGSGILDNLAAGGRIGANTDVDLSSMKGALVAPKPFDDASTGDAQNIGLADIAVFFAQNVPEVASRLGITSGSYTGVDVGPAISAAGLALERGKDYAPTPLDKLYPHPGGGLRRFGGYSADVALDALKSFDLTGISHYGQTSPALFDSLKSADFAGRAAVVQYLQGLDLSSVEDDTARGQLRVLQTALGQVGAEGLAERFIESDTQGYGDLGMSVEELFPDSLREDVPKPIPEEELHAKLVEADAKDNQILADALGQLKVRRDNLRELPRGHRIDVQFGPGVRLVTLTDSERLGREKALTEDIERMEAAKEALKTSSVISGRFSALLDVILGRAGGKEKISPALTPDALVKVFDTGLVAMGLGKRGIGIDTAEPPISTWSSSIASAIKRGDYSTGIDRFFELATNQTSDLTPENVRRELTAAERDGQLSVFRRHLKGLEQTYRAVLDSPIGRSFRHSEIAPDIAALIDNEDGAFDKAPPAARAFIFANAVHAYVRTH